MGTGMKYSVIGIVLWICAGIYWGFEKISSVVPQDYTSSEPKHLDIFSIEALFGLDWIDSLPVQLHNAATFIAETHISLLLLAIGLVFIIIGMFFKT